MHSSLIGKVEKAKAYARERDRMHIHSMRVQFRGENAEHAVEIVDDTWHCTCDFFQQWNTCSHTMALERVLEGMVPPTTAREFASV